MTLTNSAPVSSPVWDRKTVPAIVFPLMTRLEGCKLAAHWDTLSRQYDIGYGSLHMPNGAKVKAGDTISQAEANAMAAASAATWVHDIVAAITWSLTEAEAAALILFLHNVGGGAADSDSTFVSMANAGRMDLTFGQMIGWSHSGGKLVLGLMHRNEYQRQIAMGECVDSLSAYSAVFGMTEAQLMPLYNDAYAQAAKWGHTGGMIVTGPAIVASTKPAPVPKSAPVKAAISSPAQPTADALMEKFNPTVGT